MRRSMFEKAWLDDPREVQRDACGVGFIAQLKGVASHQIVSDGLTILKRLDHRGGRASDGRTSDGAGIQLQLPREFFKHAAAKAGVQLPARYAVAQLFLPKEQVQSWLARFAEIARERNFDALWSRIVPCDTSVLGEIAQASEPRVVQVFLESKADAQEEWRLYTVRKALESEAIAAYGLKQHHVYCSSLSFQTICYKGLIAAEDFADYYTDLKNPLFKSALSLVHQRFSTNTLPAWPLAQPFRILCHNGEINTLRGNLSAMQARSALLTSEQHQELDKVAPICVPGFSDSSMLDNTLEFLLHTGRSLTEALTMLVPEPWEQNTEMPAALRAYYEYQSYRMEPWDGPAFIGFTDGLRVGAILDRNGLRPGRYWVTSDDQVIMASEAGVIDRRPEDIVMKGRLSPGRIFMVDLAAGVIIPDQELKDELSRREPYEQWLREHRTFLEDYELLVDAEPEDHRLRRLKAFGYAEEDLRTLLIPMAKEGKEPVGSMGTDIPLAVLSDRRPPLFDYFKQLFAQVTNPPIDAIREELVTSIASHIGAETNLFESNRHKVIRLEHPVLLAGDMRDIKRMKGFHAVTLSLSFPKELTFEAALHDLKERASAAVRYGAHILILSDRGVSEGRLALPSLLATSAVHHGLMSLGLRAQTSLVIESGDAREVHHFALLFAYGAAAVHPYLALEAIERADASSGLGEIDPWKRSLNFRKAIEAGLLKIMSKMGISTLQSYRGAQIFEALGLSRDCVDAYFPWTQTRIEGVDLASIEADVRFRHASAYRPHEVDLDDAGVYSWRPDGEKHLHDPAMISRLQKATRINSREEFKAFCKGVDESGNHLRSLLQIKPAAPIPLEEVEPVTAIVKRFATGAMSFGSISKETHETVAIAMNRLGAKSNSGEGGEDPERYHPLPNGDSRRSAIKQVASARFGVSSHYLVNADELQIKMAQGAKPGEGGQLPGDKVDSEIARVRHSTPGITLISPPPHHDIYSIEDLAQLIFDLKHANDRARISVKLVSEVGVGTIAAGVSKAKADVILISGYEGGTGASPLSSIRHAGLPWELGLSETQKALVDNGLRSRTVLQVDGQLRTPRDIAIATMLGAEEWGIGTGALVALGCVMMRKCHLNTCPVGIATQDPELRARFQGQPEHLINYMFLLAEGLREIMAGLGIRRVVDLVGRSDLLEKKPFPADSKKGRIDLSALLTRSPSMHPASSSEKQEHGIEHHFDVRELVASSQPALQGLRSVSIARRVQNTDRAVGTYLSSIISRLYGAEGLNAHAINLNLIGIGGQSFMAFGAAGLKVRLEGEANDYCGKGLSGATVAILPPLLSASVHQNEIICGNVALYGATSGQFYARGAAGERFAVRNSGAHAVVEGVGDHGCEYMTGGSVIVLGPIGRNFGAGMSGGLAFLYDKGGLAGDRINEELLTVTRGLTKEDEPLVWQQLEDHLRLTGSPLAKRILSRWAFEQRFFLTVVPTAYKALKRREAVRPATVVTRELEQGGIHG